MVALIFVVYLFIYPLSIHCLCNSYFSFSWRLFIGILMKGKYKILTQVNQMSVQMRKALLMYVNFFCTVSHHLNYRWKSCNHFFDIFRTWYIQDNYTVSTMIIWKFSISTQTIVSFLCRIQGKANVRKDRKEKLKKILCIRYVKFDVPWGNRQILHGEILKIFFKFPRF